MKFNHTYNYGQTDLDKEENQILWKFGELIKNLITIASDAARQKDIIGFGAITDELASDFDSYFSLSYKQYVDNNLLNAVVLKELLMLKDIFEQYSGDENPDFWEDSLLDTNEDWIEVRLIAKNILELMGLSDLDIEFIHSDIVDEDRVIGQQTTTRLVNKKV